MPSFFVLDNTTLIQHSLVLNNIKLSHSLISSITINITFTAIARLAPCFASPGGRVLNEATLEALAVLGKTAADYRYPGSFPFPNEKPGTNMLPGIEHIVLIIWENHSWDN